MRVLLLLLILLFTLGSCSVSPTLPNAVVDAGVVQSSPVSLASSCGSIVPASLAADLDPEVVELNKQLGSNCQTLEQQLCINGPLTPECEHRLQSVVKLVRKANTHGEL